MAEILNLDEGLDWVVSRIPRMVLPGIVTVNSTEAHQGKTHFSKRLVNEIWRAYALRPLLHKCGYNLSSVLESGYLGCKTGEVYVFETEFLPAESGVREILDDNAVRSFGKKVDLSVFIYNPSMHEMNEDQIGRYVDLIVRNPDSVIKDLK